MNYDIGESGAKIFHRDISPNFGTEGSSYAKFITILALGPTFMQEVHYGEA